MKYIKTTPGIELQFVNFKSKYLQLRVLFQHILIFYKSISVQMRICLNFPAHNF